MASSPKNSARPPDVLDSQSRALFEAIQQPLLLLRSNDDIIAANAAACSLYGWSEAEIQSRGLSTLRGGAAANPAGEIHHGKGGSYLQVQLAFAEFPAGGQAYRCTTIT